MRRTLLVLTVAMGLSGEVAAQDWGNFAGDLAVSQLQHRAMEDMLGIDTYSSRGSRSTRSVAGGMSFAIPTKPGSRAPAFPYVSTPGLRRAAIENYVIRLRQNNPTAADAISSEFGRHDYERIYTGIVAPYGYRADDAADGLAAYTLLGWLIANGQADVSPRQAAAVRTQIALRAADSPVFANPIRRAQLGEELKLLFVTLHAGWQSAAREGTQRQYADGIAAMFRGSATDLRALRLSDTGFVGR